METSQLLDLMNYSGPGSSESSKIEDGDDGLMITEPQKKKGKEAGLASVLKGLGDLWDTAEYQEEYNVESYISSLTKAAGI